MDVGRGTNEKQGFLGTSKHPSTGSIRRPLKSWNNADGKTSAVSERHWTGGQGGELIESGKSQM